MQGSKWRPHGKRHRAGWACEAVHKHPSHYETSCAVRQPEPGRCRACEDDVRHVVSRTEDELTADAAQAILRGAWWAPALAFAAGVVSFASPCVLPLVPGYLSFVTGQGAVGYSDHPAAQGDRASTQRPLVPVLLFILGFSVVFTFVFGFTASAASRWIRSDIGQRVAGGFVLVFGLFMLLYAFRARLTWLYREERPLLSRVRPGPAGAFPLGMAFAVGWTPCIGPVLGAVATLALGQGSTARAVLLLVAYSMGLGVPFFLVGMGVSRVMGAFRFFSRHYRVFAAVSGLAMIAIGVLLVSGLWVRLLSPVLNEVNRFTPPI